MQILQWPIQRLQLLRYCTGINHSCRSLNHLCRGFNHWCRGCNHPRRGFNHSCRSFTNSGKCFNHPCRAFNQSSRCFKYSHRVCNKLCRSFNHPYRGFKHSCRGFLYLNSTKQRLSSTDASFCWLLPCKQEFLLPKESFFFFFAKSSGFNCSCTGFTDINQRLLFFEADASLV